MKSGKKIIGIDIGGTKIAGVVFDGRKILHEIKIVTPSNLSEFKRNLFKLTDFLSAKDKIEGIGIGAAGQANPKTGKVTVTGNMKFKATLNLVKLFKERYHLPVKIDNDANCFARAELLLGQGKKYTNFLGLTLGTGIGGGIVIEKKLYRGTHNSGAELGYFIFADPLYLEQVFQKYRDQKNDKKMGIVLGKGFASLANIFAPQTIILGGSVSENAGSRFLPHARKEMQKFMLDKNLGAKLLISKIKNAGAIGAALMLYYEKK